MAGYGGGHPAECPKCGSPPWESCFAADDCLRTVSSDMKKANILPNTEDKHGFAPCQWDWNNIGYWQHSGNQKLYEVLKFTYLWTDEWGITYRALGEDTEHTQPAYRFLGERDRQRRFRFVPLHEVTMPDPMAYREDAENINTAYSAIYTRDYGEIEKPYAGDEPLKPVSRFRRWLRGFKE